MRKLPVTYEGTVIDGLGSSNEWMPGYLPQFYPGTLNVMLDEHPGEIPWEVSVDTHFGHPVLMTHGTVNLLPVTIIRPPLAKRNTKMVELASPYKLRDHLKLVTGARVTITIGDPFEDTVL